MTILIKGMEMPENCAKCPICASIPLSDYAVYHKCVLLNRLASKHNRRYDCPLVPVPTPHGCLKDADELIKHDHQHYEYLSDEFYVLVRDIENAPTIIEAEEG